MTEPPGLDGPAGTGASNSGAGGSSSSAGGGTGVGAEGGQIFVPGTAGRSNRIDSDASCEALAVQGEKIQEVIEEEITETIEVPAVFYIVQDRSGSMVSDQFQLFNDLACALLPFLCPNGPPPVPPSKWDYAVAGLTEFVNDPGSTGIDLALHYFPGGGECDGSGYDTPTVPMGTLPQNAPTIVNSLAGQAPNGNTPVEGALRGATRYCTNYNATNEDRTCVVVLITDGEPSGCNEDHQVLTQIAADANQQGVLTFAAGMEGADFQLLEQIAQAGGGNCNDNGNWACNLTTSATSFTESLVRIRQTVDTVTRTETRVVETVTEVPCEWTIPDPPEGESFDPELVNVDFSVGGGVPQAVGKVAGEAECAMAEGGGGWYYDTPDAPTAIKVCPNTCTTIQATDDARVDVKFGCATEPAKFQ